MQAPRGLLNCANWKSDFNSSFDPSYRWTSRIEIMNEIQLLSLAQDSSCLVDKKNKGGKAAVVRCSSTIKDGRDCNFYAKVRRSSKDGKWYITQSFQPHHSCVGDVCDKKRLSKMLHFRKSYLEEQYSTNSSDLARDDLQNRLHYTERYASVDIDEDAYSTVGTGVLRVYNHMTPASTTDLNSATTDHIPQAHILSELYCEYPREDHAGQAGQPPQPASAIECLPNQKGLFPMYMYPYEHVSSVNQLLNAESQRKSVGYGLQSGDPLVKRLKRTYKCSSCNSSSHTLPTCPDKAKYKRSRVLAMRHMHATGESLLRVVPSGCLDMGYFTSIPCDTEHSQTEGVFVTVENGLAGAHEIDGGTMHYGESDASQS